ncbi:LytTR family transcriptional regulator DNA-binding domain-containing protein [Acutalibacter muris]|jgi:two-component system response regulator LytT|uniref:LytTR family transcriptional regulator n=1 Tax=Acutalibacter muris TaxID=1796620 RepID=A0A1Z2XN60_9FIRM|nr:LytTR family DNA-binding domain-containing protein [Acutalibacter muris]ANU53460.1 histidine kinase [Hungateiclostridiaceae bacterium KB18]ASB39864.1 LytTR family transcriptional regulator [Acutalibacter muris]MCI9191975.1 LytTR family transcriptional regulator [Acutalibacter muris]MCI9544294.1 LytTR family transcriptional regulator [Acutalibacter muris]QQR29153.1 LytTR family transcriptional regulator DNA-binding domain-containing protein [Acutalibacter muris]
MKIKMEVAPGITEPEIILRCAEAGEAAAGLLARLYELAAGETGKLTGQLEGQTYLLDPAKVLYADTADKRAFLYTAGAVYETELRLYELEERLRGRGFFRASKSALVNFNAIRSLRPDLGGRIRLTMENGEAVYVSRQYAPWLKKKLGL